MKGEREGRESIRKQCNRPEEQQACGTPSEQHKLRSCAGMQEVPDKAPLMPSAHPSLAVVTEIPSLIILLNQSNCPAYG